MKNALNIMKNAFEILGNRVSGHTVELIKQVGGNLRTSSLKSANF